MVLLQLIHSDVPSLPSLASRYHCFIGLELLVLWGCLSVGADGMKTMIGSSLFAIVAVINVNSLTKISLLFETGMVRLLENHNTDHSANS